MRAATAVRRAGDGPPFVRRLGDLYRKYNAKRIFLRLVTENEKGTSGHVIPFGMTRDGKRFCDHCGQPIPLTSKLSDRQDGADLCLQCRIRAAQEKR